MARSPHQGTCRALVGQGGGTRYRFSSVCSLKFCLLALEPRQTADRGDLTIPFFTIAKLRPSFRHYRV